MQDNNIAKCALTETHLDSTVDDNGLYIDGYVMVRNDRKIGGRRGGGTGITVVR